MSGLTAIFGNSEEDSPDNEKLLQLYWNRNELKKQFAAMRKEQFRLKDRIQEEEGTSARLQQKLDHLEELLVDPEWSRSVAVFYQLRGLALSCERKLARFAEQIKQQREQKQNEQRLAAWNNERAETSKTIGREVLERRNNIQLFEDRREAERRRLQDLGGFTRFIRRRSVGAIIDRISENIQLEEREEAALQAQLAQMKARTPPETVGLDIPTKRSINFMILAYAQHLFVRFGDKTLVSLVKEAGEKSVGSVNYGSEKECDNLMGRIRSSIEAIDSDTDFADLLRMRARLISEKALFNKDDDAVPVDATVATLFEIDGKGRIRESDANLLGDNYWRIATVLSR